MHTTRPISFNIRFLIHLLSPIASRFTPQLCSSQHYRLTCPTPVAHLQVNLRYWSVEGSGCMKESTAVQKYNYRMRSSFEKNRMVGNDLSHFAIVRRAATKVRCEASSWMRVTCNETQKGCIKPCPRESRTVVLWENRPSEDLHHRRSLFHDQLTHQ